MPKKHNCYSCAFKINFKYNQNKSEFFIVCIVEPSDILWIHKLAEQMFCERYRERNIFNDT